MGFHLALKNYLYSHVVPSATEYEEMKKILWVVVIFLVLGSCLDQPECLNMDTNYIGISFMKMFDGKADTVAFYAIESPESDSVFYSYKLRTSIELPMNQYESQTNFTFSTAYGDKFLNMEYDRDIEFVSEDCGSRYFIRNLEATDTDFDSLSFITTTLTNPAQINLEVYRCPRTNLAKVSFRQLIGPDIKADTVYLDSLETNFQTTFFIPNAALTSVNLPLNPNSTTATYTFYFNDGAIKTITLNYITTPWLEFLQRCGPLKLYSSVSVSAHDFTDVQISNDSIQDPPVTNAAIFK